MRVRTMAILAAFGAVLAGPGTAQGDRAGDFDYYVMALSWSPSWCDIEGETEGQCAPERDAGWLLHGLWPQHETGWPSHCPTTQPDQIGRAHV